MSIRTRLESPAALLHDFLFKPEPIGFLPWIRVAAGTLICLKLAALQPDLGFFFAEDGVLPLEQARNAAPWVATHWYALAPSAAESWRLLNAAAFCASLLGLVLGVLFRPMAILLFVWMGTLQGRNELVWNSADRLLMILLLFLCFSHADSGLSWFQRESLHVRARFSPFARRLIQLQMTLVYFATAAAKSSGRMWQDGTAVLPVLQLEEFFHGPLGPLRDSIWFSRLASWSTLVIEFAAATLIWVPALRLPVIGVTLLFHLGLDYSLNIPLFQWLMIAGLCSHLDPRLAETWAEAIQRRLARLEIARARLTGSAP